MNEIISVSLYAEVLDRTASSLKCRDLHTGQELTLYSTDGFSRINSADTFKEIRRITRTEMAQILSDACCDVFTVTFIKQDGSERVLRGRVVQSENILGRVMVEDLDLSTSMNYRQVDLRTIKNLVIQGIKYVLK